MHIVLYFLFRLLAARGWSRLAARLLILTTRDINKRVPGGKCILVLTRAGLNEDVNASFRTADGINLICWPSFALKAFASAILSPVLDHNNYLTDDVAVEQTKVEYREFLAQLWAGFVATKHVDAVLTGNFAYFTEREFASVLEEQGTPFIALHKENVRPPRRVRDYWFPLYKHRRGKFTGRKILVYNELERQLEITSGVAHPDKIVVTGAPRLDRLHQWRTSNSPKSDNNDRPSVLFFAFARQEKLTAIHRKASAGIPGNAEPLKGSWGKLTWGQFCIDTHRVIVDLARSYPEFDVVIKTKGQKRRRADIEELISDLEAPLPHNVQLITGGDPFDLITRSNVVIGFNTTGLLEAIAAGKPVIVPVFGEAARKSMRDLIIDLGDAVEYARSPAQLREMVRDYAMKNMKPVRDLSGDAREILRYWAGNDDGLAGSRVLNAIRSELR